MPPETIAISAATTTAFVNAVHDVFQKMVGIETKVLKPYVKEGRHPVYEVCGIIGFTGRVVGSVVLSFSTDAAIKIVERFAGTAFTVDDGDFVDAIGELANIVIGSAKRDFGVEAGISVPTVIVGGGYKIATLSNTPCIVIPCESKLGNFAIEICIKQTV